MKKLTCFNLFVFLVYFVFSNFASAQKAEVERISKNQIEILKGQATDKNKKIFYNETSRLTYRQGKLTNIDTTFMSEDSRLMAELHATFKKLSYLPDVHFKDHRDQYEYKITYNPDENLVAASKKEDEKSNWSTKNLAFTENMTNSVGLMIYIHDHALDIQKQKRKIFRYIIPSRQDDFGMRIEFASEENTLLNFDVKMDNALIRALAGSNESRVQFNPKKSQITQFKGVSSLLDKNNHPVEIVLVYQPIEIELATPIDPMSPN